MHGFRKASAQQDGPELQVVAQVNYLHQTSFSSKCGNRDKLKLAERLYGSSPRDFESSFHSKNLGQPCDLFWQRECGVNDLVGVSTLIPRKPWNINLLLLEPRCYIKKCGLASLRSKNISREAVITQTCEWDILVHLVPFGPPDACSYHQTSRGAAQRAQNK